MATVSPLSMAQCLVPCPTCETSTNVDWKCNLCEKYFCYRCGKIHVSIKKYKDHRVYNINKPGGLPILSTVRCNVHSDKDIYTYCRKCDKFMCTKCVGKSKNCKHSHMELEDLYVEKMKTLDKNRDRFEENVLDFFITEGERLKKTLDLQKENYETERQKIIEHDQTLKDMITLRTNKLLHDLEDHWENIQHDMNKLTSQLEQKIQKLKNKLSAVDEIKNCIDIEHIHTLTKEINDFVLSEDVSFLTLPNETKSLQKGEVNQGLVDKLVGTLKSETINFIDFRVVNSYTYMGRITSITAADNNTAWITSEHYYNSTIRKVELGSIVPKTLMEIEHPLGRDITVLNSGHLLIAVYYDPCIKQLAPSGEVTIFYQFPNTWLGHPQIPVSLHVNSEGFVCVGTKKQGIMGKLDVSSHGQLVTLTPIGERLKLYEYDGDGNPLFRFPHRITSNKYGDICVVDWTADKGRLVTINSNGKLKWIYNGFSDSKQTFFPGDLVTTFQDNIIVSDFNNAFHILNYEGQLTKYINTKKFGIIGPICLDIDYKGRLLTSCVKERNLRMLLLTGC